MVGSQKLGGPPQEMMESCCDRRLGLWREGDTEWTLKLVAPIAQDAIDKRSAACDRWLFPD